jgi:D-glycero-D-manno-heptose 1,7-bisphosphate phosphatase
MGNIALFLDRDGTINEDRGYISEITALHIFPYTAATIKRFNDAEIKIILVTNQSGIARGYLSEDTLTTLHQHLCAQLAKYGAHLDAIYYCPHHPTIGLPPYRRDCNCRKPAPGLITQALKEHEIDLKNSFVVGDKYSDIALAHAVGACGVMVLTGYGEQQWREHHTWPQLPAYMARDLADAGEWIMRKIKDAKPVGLSLTS